MRFGYDKYPNFVTGVHIMKRYLEDLKANCWRKHRYFGLTPIQLIAVAYIAVSVAGSDWNSILRLAGCAIGVGIFEVIIVLGERAGREMLIVLGSNAWHFLFIEKFGIIYFMNQVLILAW